MPAPMMLVSVIVPVYNGAAYLAEAIASIRQQTGVAYEILIVDDGSTDDTARLAASLGNGLRYHYQPNQGPAAARNRGIALASGDLLAFLDADDVWPPGKLERQVATLIETDLLEVVLGHTRLLLPTASPGHFALDNKLWLSALMGSLVIRHAAVERAGLLDPAMPYGEDIDWFLRARELGAPVKIIPDVTLHYRIHQDSMTHGKNPLELKLAEVIKRSLDRRRGLEQSAGASESGTPGVPPETRASSGAVR